MMITTGTIMEKVDNFECNVQCYQQGQTVVQTDGSTHHYTGQH